MVRLSGIRMLQIVLGNLKGFSEGFCDLLVDISYEPHDYSQVADMLNLVSLAERIALILEHVKWRFLTFTGYILRINHSLHDYSPVLNVLSLDTLADRMVDANLKFLHRIIYGTYDTPTLLFLVFSEFLNTQHALLLHFLSLFVSQTVVRITPLTGQYV